MQKPYILIIDDDNRLRRLLHRYLTNHDFNVSEMPSADEAFKLLSIIQYDLIVVDVMMPGTNGYDFVKKLRSEGNPVPILMLTAMGETDNRITGLECGADDYLGKPFDPKELVLRINNILRRTQRDQSNDTVIFGDCSFNLKTGILLRNSEPILLTGAETELLRFLVERIGQVVSREELTKLIKSDNERTVDVQMTRLRKKIEVDEAHSVYIQTVRGQGYRLVGV